MPSRVVAGEIETNVIYIPDSTAIISTGGGNDESLKDLLDSKEDRIQLPTQRAVATDPAGRLLASQVTSDEQNTLQDINTEVTIQDQFDAITDVVDIMDSRRFEYTCIGSETGLLTFPMMKFPFMSNDHKGTIIIKGYATFETASVNTQHVQFYDALLNVEGTSGVEKTISIRGRWSAEATVPFELAFASINAGGQQGSTDTWVCMTASFVDETYIPKRFSLLVETDMGSDKFASDGPYQNVPPGFVGYQFIFANEAQVIVPNENAILMKDNLISAYPYGWEGASLKSTTLEVNGDSTFTNLVPVDGTTIRPAMIDASGKLVVSTQATSEDIEALPALRTNVAKLGTAIQFDPDTKSLYLGKEDLADTIYISNPVGENSQTIYLGSAKDQVIIQGETTIIDSTTHSVTDPYMTLNVGGTSPTGAGIFVESGGSNVASLQITETGRWQVTEPDTSAFVLSDRFEANEGDIAALQAQIGGGGGGSLTGDRALITNSTGSIVTSEVTVAQLAQLIGVTSPIQTQLDAKQDTIEGVTQTELEYLSGVTSAVQPQLDGKQATITGAASTITSSNLTASRALTSDPSGKVAVSATTATQLGYLSTTTSNVQTQLNSKQATITGGATTITSSNLTASRALTSDTSGKVAVSATTATQLEYLSTTTSNVQDQLDSKQATITGAASTVTTSKLTASRAVVSNSSGDIAVSATTATQLGYLSTTTSNVQTQLNSKLSTTGGSLTGKLTVGNGDTGMNGQIIFGAPPYSIYHETSTNDMVIQATGNDGLHGGLSFRSGTTGGSAEVMRVLSTGHIISNNLTGERALVSSSAKGISSSSVTATELGYVSGVTSAIQPQIDGKQATITGAASTITSSDLTASRALVSDASGKVSASAVTALELGYLSGVQSNIHDDYIFLSEKKPWVYKWTSTTINLANRPIIIAGRVTGRANANEYIVNLGSVSEVLSVTANPVVSASLNDRTTVHITSISSNSFGFRTLNSSNFTADSITFTATVIEF